jgi:predicted metal-binding protein
MLMPTSTVNRCMNSGQLCQNTTMTELIVCINLRPFAGQPSCAARGSRDLADYLEQAIACRKLDTKVQRVVCLGHCQRGPNVRIAGGFFIHEANTARLDALLDALETGDAFTDVP